jgi:pimeloyl-ACP methyl ester carboxylesterase
VTFAQRDVSDLVPGAGFAHEGFGDVYRSVRDELHTELQRLIDERETPAIWIGGHSLGGALSVLAAVDIAENLGVAPALYTFAGPRVGDLEFQQAYRDRVPHSWRIINEHDLVPRFPPRSAAVTRGGTREIRRYAHVNAEHLLTFGVSIYAPAQSALDAGLDLDPSTPIDLDAEGVDWAAPTVIENHGVCSYFSHLCDGEDDPAACRLKSDGRDGCNAEELEAALGAG